MAVPHPVVAALAEHHDGKRFFPVPLSGDPHRVLFYSKFPLPQGRQRLVREVAEGHRVGFYSFQCVKAKKFGETIDLPFKGWAQDVLTKVHATVIVLIGTEEPDIRGKHFVKLSTAPSLKGAGGDQSKLTELWETWFKGEWEKVFKCITEHVDTADAKANLFKRKAEVELKGPESKVSKEEKIKCVEEKLNFNW